MSTRTLKRFFARSSAAVSLALGMVVFALVTSCWPTIIHGFGEGAGTL